MVLTTANSNLVDGDNVTVPYTYTFAKDDVKTAGNDKNVTITLKDLTGADKDNYTFDKTQVTTAKGNVTQDAMSDIEISGPTKVTYTYPELTPDFGGLVVNAVYGTMVLRQQRLLLQTTSYWIKTVTNLIRLQSFLMEIQQ